MRVLLITLYIFLLCDYVSTRFLINFCPLFISHQSLLYHSIPIFISSQFICIVYHPLINISLHLKLWRLTSQWNRLYWPKFVKIIWPYPSVSKRKLVGYLIRILVEVLMKFINQFFFWLHFYFILIIIFSSN